MLKAAVFTTEQFVAWIGGKLDPDLKDMSTEVLRNAVSSNFCAIVSDRDSGNEQLAVLLDPRNTRDFYAFVSTYVSDYVPFSAYFRVVHLDQLSLMEPAGLFNRDTQFAKYLRPLVGVAIAEAACYLQTKGNPAEEVAVGAVTATYSAAILQGLALGQSVDISIIGKNWISLRALIGGHDLSIPAAALHDFWQIVSAATHGRTLQTRVAEHRVIYNVMRRVLERPTGGNSEYEAIFALLPELNGPFSRLRGPREERTRAVQEMLATLQNASKLTSLVKDCVAGCLVSMLGDGSFQFLPLMLSHTKHFPTAPLWFAAWASFMPGTDVLTTGRGLGRRVARDLLNGPEIFSSPTDDIALEELRAIGSDINGLPRSQSNSVSVEIFPTVSSRQRISQAQVSAAVQQTSSNEKELKELRYLLTQSSTVLARMENSGKDESGRTSAAKNASASKRRY